MSLPDFLVIGAPKAGSTAVHDALEQHPDLFLSTPKEPKFFMTDNRPPARNTQRGPGDRHSAREWVWRRDQYERLFANAPKGTLRGESTPFYLWDRDAQRRIATLIPEVKLIAIIRDPVDRAYSNWGHLWCDGLEPEADFAAACRLEPERVRDGYAPFWRYLELGRYGEQLEHLFTLFPRRNVHVLRYRDLIEEPIPALDKVFAFLGVETGRVQEIPSSNVSAWAPDDGGSIVVRRAIRAGAALGAYAPPDLWRRASRPLVSKLRRSDANRPRLAPEHRRQLVEYFRDDIALLESLLGESFQDWLTETDRGTYAVRKS